MPARKKPESIGAYLSGFSPEVQTIPKLEKEAARYAGEKGNPKFPLSEPILCEQIGRIAKFKAKEHAQRAVAKKVRKKRG